jgi:hypothetical protein
MNENDIYTMLQGDDNLREAIRHREQKQPPMPADLNERLMKRMEAGEFHRLLLVGSGAMLSPTSSQQGQSVPGIAYAACIEGGEA